MNRIRWAVCLLMTVLIMTGCSGQTSKEPLKIGVMADLGAVPFVMAQEMGYYEDAGIEVEIQVFRSALDRDAALQTGNLDGAMVDMLTLIFFNDAEMDMVMLSGTEGGYHLVASSEHEGEFSDSDESVEIGLSTNTVIDFATQIIAEEEGFDDRLVKVAIPKMPVRLEMLAAGELDGATLPEPLASASVNAGSVRISSTEDFGMYPGIFMVSRQTAQEEKERLQALYQGYNKAVDLINSGGLIEHYAVFEETLGFPRQIPERFESIAFYYAAAPDRATYDRVCEWMKEWDLTESNYLYENLSDLSMIKK